ncbi:hypothetical protein JVU11DRAFT_702 [Chiua virens]|nr:hypothetical protein JVU11DRAFT_702 [Chiua virens]
MDVSLAVREYVQNQVGQVLKEMETLEWSDWVHTRLDDSSELAARRELKDKVISSYPGLLSGPHGSRLRMDSAWLPEYVASAKIPRDTLKKTPHASDLDICNVVWRHQVTQTIALSLFNNHLDSSTSPATFVTPGASTSRESLWAPGQNGKGFMTATQFFHEFVQQEPRSEGGVSPGISFRIGHDIGEVSWDKTTCHLCHPSIIIKFDELFPFTASDLMEKKALTEQDAAMEVASMSRRRMMYNMSRPQATLKCTDDMQQGLFREHSMVECDEVSITVVGLPSDITPEIIFCGTFGLFKPSRSWRIPNALFEFFLNPGNVPLFYYRGQLMPSARTGLARVGINYHGTLEICPEASQVKKNNIIYGRYQHLLQEAIQYAFCHLPELAVELACDIMAKAKGEEHRNFEMFSPKRRQNLQDVAYRSAFCAAWQQMGADGPGSKRLYPYSELAPQDLRLIEELDMIGQSVPSKVMELVIVPSGAFLPIKEYAESVFLERRGVGSGFVGFVQFRRAMLDVFSWAANSDIVMVDYTNSYPKVLWDERTKQFVLGIPYCTLHPTDECSCWLPSYLLEARDAYCKHSTNKDKTEVAALSYGIFFRAYALAMGADSKQLDSRAKGIWLARKRKAPSFFKLCDQQEPAKRPRSDTQHGRKVSDSTQESDMDVARSSDPPGPARSRSHPLPPSPAELKSSMFVEASHTATDPGNAHSHSLAELFKPIMCAYDRSLDAVSSQAASFEIQRQHLIAENIQREKEIATLRAQVAEEHAKAQCFRAQLQAVQTERDQTRDLLVAKWRQNK